MCGTWPSPAAAQPALAAGNRVDDELHPLLEDRRRAGEHVLIAADHECRRLDVRPVVHDGVGVDHLADERLDHRESRPVGAQRPRVADARVSSNAGVQAAGLCATYRISDAFTDWNVAASVRL